MDLYTIIMDFRGGTYIEQVKAASPEKATIKWAVKLNVKEIPYLSENSRMSLIAAIPIMLKDKEIIKLDNLQNIWSFTFQFKTGYAIVNVIKTLN